MKISRHCVLPLLSLMACCLLGTGCSRDEQKVLVVLNSQMDLSYGDLEAAAKQWVGEKNISLQVAAPKLSTVYGQQEVLENSIKENTWDLIVVEPLGEDELYPILDYAREQGSTVVAMQGSKKLHADYTIHPCEYEKLGTSMMDALAGEMEESGSYVSMVPDKDSEIILQEERSGVDHQKSRYQRMLAASRLQQGGDVKTAYDSAEALYQAYEMKGILFFSYIDGLGISQWKKHTGNQVAAVGIGDPEVMEQDLEDGTIDILFYWNRQNLLQASLEVGYQAINQRIEKTTDVVTTNIEGYRTLRPADEGVYFGDDISIVNSDP